MENHGIKEKSWNFTILKIPGGNLAKKKLKFYRKKLNELFKMSNKKCI